MHNCNKKRKVAYYVGALALVVGLVGAVECPWMRGHLNSAYQQVKTLNPVNLLR